jgi:hypothetical protein
MENHGLRRVVNSLIVVQALALVAAAAAAAQPGPPQTTAATPKSAKDGAAIDLTGYWVSVVTEDWRWRMVTPLKGDAASVPTNAAARKLIDAWDPAKDEAAGLQCKGYGAPAIMRVPGRLNITWQDENTLKIETDAGQQTRLLHFIGEPPRGAAPSWQGYSTAKWEAPMTSGFPVISFVPGPRAGPKTRTLEVATSNLRAGYLRKNGVPYSEKTILKEYFDRFDEPNGNAWFMVTTVVEDPVYLAVPFVTTSHFKKQGDASGWHPEPCMAR